MASRKSANPSKGEDESVLERGSKRPSSSSSKYNYYRVINSLQSAIGSRQQQDPQQRTNRVGQFGMLSVKQQTSPQPNCTSIPPLYYIGQSIAKNLRNGRGVQVPFFGLFTLAGSEEIAQAQPQQQNKQTEERESRQPVFVVESQFVPDIQLKTAIIISNGQQLLPFTSKRQNGSVPLINMSFSEISNYCNLNLSDVKTSIERSLDRLRDSIRKKGRVEVDIPNVGVMRIANGMCAVAFKERLAADTRYVVARNQTEKKCIDERSLTREKLKAFQTTQLLANPNRITYENQPLVLEKGAKQYLLNMGIDIDEDFKSTSSRGSYFRAVSVAGSVSTRDSFVAISTWKNNKNNDSQSIALSKSSAAITSTSSKQGKLKEEIHYWIRSKHMNPEDSFIEFCKKCEIGNTASKKQRLSKEDIEKGWANINEGTANKQKSLQLFLELDSNKDGWVDFADWKLSFSSAQITDPNLLRIKDIIKKRAIKRDDLLKTMRIPFDTRTIFFDQLKQAILFLDNSLNDQKASSVAKDILKDQNQISMSQLMKLLGCVVEESGKDSSWFSKMLFRIKEKLDENEEEFNRKIFSKSDIRGSGRIDISAFKEALMDLGIGLSHEDLQKTVRNVDKDSDGMIEYSLFLQTVYRIDRKPSGSNSFIDLTDFGQKLKKFLQSNNIRSAQNLLEYVCKFFKNKRKITINDFSEFLFKKAFKSTTLNEILKYAAIIDIDKDNIISDEDITAFLERIHYIHRPLQIVEETTTTTPSMKLPKTKLFPIERLSTPNIKLTLKEIQNVLDSKKLTASELFYSLDSNSKGFLTITEFSRNLDSFVKLSSELKDGLFATMDSDHIGVVDLEHFLRVLNNNFQSRQLKPKQTGDEDQNQSDQEEEEEDDWNWQRRITKLTIEWMNKEELSLLDAFRIMDIDFDGIISKDDLKQFLEQVLKLSHKSLTSSRINKFFKLMDEHKRGILQITDLNQFLNKSKLEETQSQKGSKSDKLSSSNYSRKSGTSSGNNERPQKKVQTEWISHAIQQIGLTLSRQFTSLSESFESITSSQTKMHMSHFQAWTAASRSLIGFDLTQSQISQVFASIDPHKKGYLILNDWLNKFKEYNWTENMKFEIGQCLEQYFKSKSKAFEYFLKENEKQVTYAAFEKAMISLFERRFSSSDYTKFWNSTWTKAVTTIDQQTFFKTLFNSPDFPETLSEDQQTKVLRRPKTAPVRQQLKKKKKNTDNRDEDASQTPTEQTTESAREEESKRVIKKLKRNLQIQLIAIEEIFEEKDPEQTGSLPLPDFKSILSSLNLSLTPKEIDVIIATSDQSEADPFSWQAFLDQHQLKETVSRIVIRQKKRLQRICEDTCYYMISPMDAFRKFSSNRSGFLTFEQFETFIELLSQLAKTEVPSLPVQKDLFEIFDCNKDGLIDQEEWSKTFARFKEPDAEYQGRPPILFGPSPGGVANSKAILIKPICIQEQKLIDSSTLAQDLKVYDDLVNIMAKNRRFLVSKFKEINSKQPLTFELALEVVHAMFLRLGKNLDLSCYQKLIRFAEREGIIDIQYLFDVYKERNSKINIHPIIN